MLLQVYPRIRDLAKTYTGCQAVFMTTTRDRPAALAWLLELNEGDPVRIWSEDKAMSQLLSCRFRRGVLIAGEPKDCKLGPFALLPSMPAGCALAVPSRDTCTYDAK
jgi:hypothetical protein